MELILIRHGEPAWVVDGLGRNDPDLTPLGRRQAELIAARLAIDPFPITEILVSPAARARQTAEPLARITGIEPVVIDDLDEMRLPDWTGEPAATVARIFQDARRRPPEAWWDGIEGGESFRAFHERIASAMARLLAERGVRPDAQGRRHLWHAQDAGDRGARVAVFAHGGANAVALGVLLGVEPTPWEWERFVLGHASIARIRAIPLAGGHVFSLRAFNDQEHLPPDARSR
ncbi:MAG: histidine phosphatase family protein [Polyangiaceae bacterium]|nr:histidine phosphatase family protein [Polyangiaceae bacterium]